MWPQPCTVDSDKEDLMLPHEEKHVAVTVCEWGWSTF